MKIHKSIKVWILIAVLSTSTLAIASSVKQPVINEQKAVEISKKYVPSGSKLIMTTIDEDDNKYSYESIYMIEGSMLYKIEVDAVTGQVSEYEAKKLDVDYSAANKYTNKTYKPKVTQAKAQQLAIKDWPNNPTIISTELKEEDNLWTYVVKFKGDNYTAEVDVDAEKEIIREQEYRKIFTTQANNVTAPATTNNITTYQDVINIAQQKVPNAKLKKLEVEYGRGNTNYKLEFIDGNKEYEINIDAKGVVTKFEQDYDD